MYIRHSSIESSVLCEIIIRQLRRGVRKSGRSKRIAYEVSVILPINNSQQDWQFAWFGKRPDQI